MTELSKPEARHLLRRMGFGGRPSEAAELTKLGRERAVDSLLDYEKVDNTAAETRLRELYPFISTRSAADLNDQNFNESELRQWWIARMILTARPFEEKVTLWLHNLFATSISTVPAVHLYAQNLDLRRFALGRFDDLLLRVAQGAAMLIWLDGAISTKSKPNENFSREIQELFSMGTHDAVTGEPNYSQADVEQIARAFTGWRFRKTSDPSPFAYEWFIDTAEADFGLKTIYGQSASFSGQDVISVLANRRATGRFLVKKFFEFFVRPLDSESAADRAIIEKFADVYFSNDHSIRELARAIFKSDVFFAADLALVKNPVEYTIGIIRRLNARFDFGTLEARPPEVELALKVMGMNILKPPDVFGWKLNQGFITSDAMLDRLNFPNLFSTRIDFNLFNANKKKTIKKTVDSFIDLLDVPGVPESAVVKLQEFMSIDFRGEVVRWRPNGDSAERFHVFEKCIVLTRLLLCMPESQLN